MATVGMVTEKIMFFANKWTKKQEFLGKVRLYRGIRFLQISIIFISFGDKTNIYLLYEYSQYLSAQRDLDDLLFKNLSTPNWKTVYR